MPIQKLLVSAILATSIALASCRGTPPFSEKVALVGVDAFERDRDGQWRPLSEDIEDPAFLEELSDILFADSLRWSRMRSGAISLAVSHYFVCELADGRQIVVYVGDWCLIAGGWTTTVSDDVADRLIDSEIWRSAR